MSGVEADDPEGEGVENWGPLISRLYAESDAEALAGLLGTGFWRTAHAREALIALGSGAVPALIAVLGNSKPEARQYAALALGEIGDRAAVPQLLELFQSYDPLLVRGPEYSVWSATAYALGALGVVEITDDLTPLLAAEDIDLVQDSAYALGLSRDPRAAPALIAALEQFGDAPHLESWIASSLTRIGGPEAEAALLAHERRQQARRDTELAKLTPEQRERNRLAAMESRARVEAALSDVMRRSRSGSITPRDERQ